MFIRIKKSASNSDLDISRLREYQAQLQSTISGIKDEIAYHWAVLYFMETYGVGNMMDTLRIQEYKQANSRHKGGN